MQLGEMQHFNNTPLGEMQSGEMQFSHYNTLLGLDLFVKIISILHIVNNKIYIYFIYV